MDWFCDCSEFWADFLLLGTLLLRRVHRLLCFIVHSFETLFGSAFLVLNRISEQISSRIWLLPFLII